MANVDESPVSPFRARMPTIVIWIELEAIAPIVVADCASEDEFRRLTDWLGSKPDLAELVGLALLSRTERPRQQETRRERARRPVR
jgi:hypothetical protein